MENIIGKRVKEIRSKLKMTQQEFADSISVSKSLISLIELGIKKPSIETINKMSNKGKVSVDYILGKTNQKNSNDEFSTDIKQNLDHTVNRISQLTEEQQKFLLKMINSMVDNIDD
ncbi:helix-turn-helix transcriptional regulator [Bacillus thuringiensis]|uniref:helix-turn-helix domain-containing protein n=1 Tax=Bacillus thuringiensis TaxID=1428 RepID=UPI00345A000F